MRIALFSRWEDQGGAALAAWRLYRGLENEHASVKYFVQHKSSEDEHVVAVNTHSPAEEYVEGIVQKYYVDGNRTPLSNTYFSFTSNNINWSAVFQGDTHDVVNLHWTEKMISSQSLQRLISLGSPVVWTLHDERPFTGGCHYTAGCLGFIENKCHQCLQLRDDPGNLAEAQLAMRIDAIGEGGLTVVTPSSWLADRARKSLVFRHARVEVIPNSLDLQEYRPTDKALAKTQLGISPDVVTILAGAHNNREHRKGLDLFVAAMKILLRRPYYKQMAVLGRIVVLTVGGGGSAFGGIDGVVRNLGYVRDSKEMARIYSASDMFVLSTREDNLPNTILESMACGTPVIAFRVGGVPEAVTDGVTGITVDPENVVALYRAIDSLASDERKRSAMKSRSIDHARRRFGLDRQAKAYLELFRNLRSEQVASAARARASMPAHAAIAGAVGISLLREKGLIATT